MAKKMHILPALFLLLALSVSPLSGCGKDEPERVPDNSHAELPALGPVNEYSQQLLQYYAALNAALNNYDSLQMVVFNDKATQTEMLLNSIDEIKETTAASLEINAPDQCREAELLFRAGMEKLEQMLEARRMYITTGEAAHQETAKELEEEAIELLNTALDEIEAIKNAGT